MPEEVCETVMEKSCRTVQEEVKPFKSLKIHKYKQIHKYNTNIQICRTVQEEVKPFDN